MNTHVTTTSPEALRAEMVERIRKAGHARRGEVERVLLDTPRHEFVPDAELAVAYDPWQAVVTHRFEDGRSLSCASAPWLVAAMLDQLDVQPGNRILEIGAGTGYNACLLAQLTGRADLVTTIDIDPDVTTQAERALAATGYGDVHVITGDGGLGYPDRAPYDRMIATDAWDLASAWWQQLAVGGRLVVPLRLHGSGLTRSIAFDRQQPDRMLSTSALVCGFVPMRGATAHAARALPLADDIVLNLDTSDPADEAALSQALTHPAHEHWTGLTVSDNEPVEHLDLWLTTTSTFARLSVGSRARESGLATPALRWAGAALHDGGTLAYLAVRPHSSEADELGVIAHGPNSDKFAAQTADLLHQWNRERPTQPTITAQPKETPDDQLPPGHHIKKPNTRLTIAW